MRNKRSEAVLLLLVSFGCAAVSYTVHAQDLHAWFQTRTQALFDAIAVGDRQVWEQTLDETCTITTEDGEVQNKAQFLAELRPLPKGFTGRGTIRGLTVQDLGASAVVHYWIDESENIFGQELKTSYVETDTYHRNAGVWKIVAMQTTVVPRDLEPLSTESAAWPTLVGEYRFPGDAQIRYRVFVRDGVLLGGRDEKSATVLIPLSPLVFFQKGSIHLMIFVRDSAGAVAEVREIHKYNEVRMQRVPAAPPT
jgi:hypothetical protein